MKKSQYLQIGLVSVALCISSDLSGQLKPPNSPFIVDLEKNINNIETINLSIIGNELSYVPLETNPECLIQSIEKVILTDLFIFINESRRLLQFDNKGKFIRQIGNVGRGPAEYLSVADFCIDDQRKEIYIISAPKLLIFSFDGIFKYSTNLSFRPAQVLLFGQNNLMFHLYNVSGKTFSQNDSWIISDKQGAILMSIKNHLRRTSQPGIIVGDTPLYLFNKDAHFLEFGIDTLYYFHENIKRPYAIFNLGGFKMDPDPLITPTTKEEVGRKLFNKFWINSVYENNDYLFLRLFRGITDSTMHAIYNKETSNLIILKGNLFFNNIDGGIGFWPKQILDDKIMVDYVDAFNLLQFIKSNQPEPKKRDYKSVPINLLNLSKQLSETSNPVLMILR